LFSYFYSIYFSEPSCFIVTKGSWEGFVEGKRKGGKITTFTLLSSETSKPVLIAEQHIKFSFDDETNTYTLFISGGNDHIVLKRRALPNKCILLLFLPF
jgi:hypothetical protein